MSRKRESIRDVKKSVGKAILDATIPQELIEKVEREVKNSKYVTPYLISEKFEVKISTAKKILRLLVEKGVIKLYSGGGRSPIYTSKL